MRIKLVILFSFCLLFASVADTNAAILPSSSPYPVEMMVKKLANMKARDMEVLLGHRLSWKERIAFTAIRAKARHYAKKGIPQEEMAMIQKSLLDPKNKTFRKEDGKSNLGKTALIFGIVGAASFVVGLVAGPLLIVSLVCSIVAIATGSAATRENSSDTKAHTGKLLGWITLLLLAALALLVVIVLASWLSWF